MALVLLLAGCGLPKQLAQDCSGDLEQGCRTLFGEPEADLDQLDRRVTDLERRMLQLENVVTSNSALISLLEINLASLSSQLETLDTANAANTAAISVLQAQMLAGQNQITSLQSGAVTLQAQTTALAMQDSVIDYLDCAVGNVIDGNGFDEIILRTKSGKLVAYFESGGNRFLSVLVPGSYRTTDQQMCAFTVNANMEMCDGLGCR